MEQNDFMALGEQAIAHYGIKGQKWGVRRKDPSGPSIDADTAPTEVDHPSTVVVRSVAGKGVRKTTGGREVPASQDAKVAAQIRQVAKASTTDALTNKELKTAIDRMSLEQQYERLAGSRPERGVKAFMKKFLKEKAKEDIKSLRDGQEAKNIKFVKDGFKKAKGARTAARATKSWQSRGPTWSSRTASRTASARGLNAANAIVKGTVLNSRPG